VKKVEVEREMGEGQGRLVREGKNGRGERVVLLRGC
jgi:hypothetical protein